MKLMYAIPEELVDYVTFENGELVALPNMPEKLVPKFEKFKKFFDNLKEPKVKK